MQYADYTLWQHQLLGSESDPDSAIARQLAFWTSTSRVCPIRSICRRTGRDRRPPAIAATGSRCACAGYSPPSAGARPRQSGPAYSWCCRRCLAALLTRLGAGSDIPIGSPIAGRTDSALDDLIGFFVNTLVLRTDTSGTPASAT